MELPDRSLAILGCIDRLIVRTECVLSYDRDLIAELPDILSENHRLKSDEQASKLPALAELFRLLSPTDPGKHSIHLLPELIRSSGVPIEKYSTHASQSRLSTVAKDFDHWSEQNAFESLDSVISLQKDLGMGAHGGHNAERKRYRAKREIDELRSYLRSVTTPPPKLMERLLRRSFWELRFSRWLKNGTLDRNVPSLSVGPRWVTEIEFFREIVGFQKHVGLDIFSDDPELVVVGDMHKMPFDDGYFQFIFLKNVVDKSYDVRQLVKELIRVVRPGGLVVVDQNCDYHGTTPLGRTDIQKAANLKRIFEAKCSVDCLVSEDIDVSGMGDALAGEKRNNARLALRLLK